MYINKSSAGIAFRYFSEAYDYSISIYLIVKEIFVYQSLNLEVEINSLLCLTNLFY